MIVGTTHTDYFPNWQDIDHVQVVLMRDGVPEEIDPEWEVPSVITDGQQVYAMVYSWSITGPAAANAYLVYTPLAPNDDIPPVEGTHFTIEERVSGTWRYASHNHNIGVYV